LEALARIDHTQTSALLKTALYHTDGNGKLGQRHEAGMAFRC